MARMLDNNGNLLGGLGAVGAGLTASPILASDAGYLPPQPPTGLPDYDAEEIVFGLECHYGTFAYSYHVSPINNVSEHPQVPACHNPIETPDERHHCAACGGEYCAMHADPLAHDCDSIIPRR